MAKLSYILKRGLQTVFMLWLVLTVLFFLFRLMPGSLIDRLVHQGADPETVESVREAWGLDQPLYIQYYRYVTNFMMLDAGQTLQYQMPVVEFVRMSIFNTFILVAPGMTVAYIVGSIIGTMMGLKRGSRFEKLSIIPVILTGAFPSFFVAILIIVVFAAWLGLFPTGGLMDPQVQAQYDTWWRPYLTTNFLHHWTLPFLTVATRYIMMPSLIMRTSVVEVRGQDFSLYHRITGLPKFKRFFNMAKHASLPVITIYPISLGRALGGLVLIEMVFNWPGIGYRLVNAVFARDYPVVMFVFFVVAAFVIIANFIVDILYSVIDPRVAVEGSE